MTTTEQNRPGLTVPAPDFDPKPSPGPAERRVVRRLYVYDGTATAVAQQIGNSLADGLHTGLLRGDLSISVETQHDSAGRLRHSHPVPVALNPLWAAVAELPPRLRAIIEDQDEPAQIGHIIKRELEAAEAVGRQALADCEQWKEQAGMLSAQASATQAYVRELESARHADFASLADRVCMSLGVDEIATPDALVAECDRLRDHCKSVHDNLDGLIKGNAEAIDKLRTEHAKAIEKARADVLESIVDRLHMDGTIDEEVYPKTGADLCAAIFALISSLDGDRRAANERASEAEARERAAVAATGHAKIEQPIPCGHTVGDLVWQPDVKATHCSACAQTIPTDASSGTGAALPDVERAIGRRLLGCVYKSLGRAPSEAEVEEFRRYLDDGQLSPAVGAIVAAMGAAAKK